MKGVSKMKKILLLVGILMVSAFMFANGGSKGSYNRGGNARGYMMGGYAEERLSDKDYKKLVGIREKHFKENQKLSLDIQAKELEIQKIMAQEKVDWARVEKLNSEKYRLLEKLDNNRLRHREEIRKTFGDEFIGNGYMRGFDGHHMMDDVYERHHRRRY
jgi:hypothetical protein